MNIHMNRNLIKIFLLINMVFSPPIFSAPYVPNNDDVIIQKLSYQGERQQTKKIRDLRAKLSTSKNKQFYRH